MQPHSCAPNALLLNWLLTRPWWARSSEGCSWQSRFAGLVAKNQSIYHPSRWRKRLFVYSAIVLCQGARHEYQKKNSREKLTRESTCLSESDFTNELHKSLRWIQEKSACHSELGISEMCSDFKKFIRKIHKAQQMNVTAKGTDISVHHFKHCLQCRSNIDVLFANCAQQCQHWPLIFAIFPHLLLCNLQLLEYQTLCGLQNYPDWRSLSFLKTD